MRVEFPVPPTIGSIDPDLFSRYPDATPRASVPKMRRYGNVEVPPRVTGIASEMLWLARNRKLSPNDGIAYSTEPLLPNRSHVPHARHLHTDMMTAFSASSPQGTLVWTGGIEAKLLQQHGVDEATIERAQAEGNVQRITDALYTQNGRDRDMVEAILVDGGVAPSELRPGVVAAMRGVLHQSGVSIRPTVEDRTFVFVAPNRFVA